MVEPRKIITFTQGVIFRNLNYDFMASPFTGKQLNYYKLKILNNGKQN